MGGNMVKVLINLVLCVTMLCGGKMEKDIKSYLTNYTQAQIIVDNNYCDISDSQQLNDVLHNMLEDCRVVPALGVALHDETIQMMQEGVWLKLQYANTIWADGMNFDTLLININRDFNGFNIIRGNQGKYEGRCYYINLNNTMQSLYDFAVNLCNKKR